MKTITVLLFTILAIPFFGQIREMQPGTVTEVKSLFAMALTPDLIKHAGSNGVVFAYTGEPSAFRYVSFDGQTSYRYDLGMVPDAMVNPFHNYSDFASDGSSVYVLWNWNPDPHLDVATCTLSRFDLDGQYRGTLKMDGKFQACYKLGMIDKDRLVLMAENMDGTPFTGLYQVNGQFIKKIALPNDVRVAPKSKDPKDFGLLEVVNDNEVANYEGFSTIDNDGDGNLFIVRRSASGVTNPDFPTVIYAVLPTGDVKSFKLEKPKTKYGNIILIRPFHRRIVVVGVEQEDLSQWAKCSMRVYGMDGKLISEHRYVPRDFGSMLLDWTPRRALFGTQAGDPNLKVKHFGIIEAIP